MCSDACLSACGADFGYAVVGISAVRLLKHSDPVTVQSRAGAGGLLANGGIVRLLGLVTILGLTAIPASAAAASDEIANRRQSHVPSSQVPDGYFYAGDLTCVVGGGFNPVLGADRDLSCTFDRPAMAPERYEGLSGLVSGKTRGAQTVVFAAWMPDPSALAALDGDFAGQRISLVGDGALVGGVRDAVVLTPKAGRAAIDLETLNALLRLNQLHLNYGGRILRTRTSRAR